jgi:hypothetical protein
MKKLQVHNAIINDGYSMRAPNGAAAVMGEGMFDGSWIEPEDFSIIEIESQYYANDGTILATIEIEWTDEMEALLSAYEGGDLVCYDGDPDIPLTDPESGGNPELEIFWAVKYRGGLAVQ